jgi:hypothetical protein
MKTKSTMPTAHVLPGAGRRDGNLPVKDGGRGDNDRLDIRSLQRQAVVGQSVAHPQ